MFRNGRGLRFQAGVANGHPIFRMKVASTGSTMLSRLSVVTSLLLDSLRTRLWIATAQNISGSIEVELLDPQKPMITTQSIQIAFGIRTEILGWLLEASGVASRCGGWILLQA